MATTGAAAMQSARHKMLVATPSKFGRSAFAVIATLSDFDYVVDGID